MRIRHRFFTLLLTSTIVASCSAETPDATSLATEAWKAEIEEAQAQAEQQNNELIQAVLQDGQVSEIELQQVEGQFDTCLKEAGFDGGGFLMRLDGGISIEGAPEGLSEDKSGELAQNCIDTSGIQLIEFAIKQRINPRNEDIVALSSRCMKERKLIDKEYSSKELEKFTAAVETLNDEDKEKALECNINPYKYIGHPDQQS